MVNDFLYCCFCVSGDEVKSEVSLFRGTSQLRVASQVRVRFESGSKFFSVFFFDYTDDVRAVTRNINFLVGDIFHSRSKEPLPVCIAVASPRYTTFFNINTFSKNIKASNLHIPEEHVPF